MARISESNLSAFVAIFSNHFHYTRISYLGHLSDLPKSFVSAQTFRMSEDFPEIASRLAMIAKGFHARGWLLGTSGNLSAVVSREPLCLAMSPSGVDKGELTAEQILLIDQHAQVLSEHSGKPSDETLLHVQIVKDRQAGAVLHTHSVWNTILSDLYATQRGLAIEGYEMLKGLDGVRTHEHREWLPILDNTQDWTAAAPRVESVLTQQPKAHGFLIRRHGLYTWGRDLAEAKRQVEILEFLFEVMGRKRGMAWQ